MNSYCLTHKEYWEFFNHYLGKEPITDIELLKKIERATVYWDLNIIGSNCFLSRILEKIIKKGKVDYDEIENIYALTDKFYFTIDQLEIDFIDALFRNNMPQQRNEAISELIEARLNKDYTKVKILEDDLQKTFEKDLINVLENYYAKQN